MSVHVTTSRESSDGPVVEDYEEGKAVELANGHLYVYSHTDGRWPNQVLGVYAPGAWLSVRRVDEAP
jgi:hypothetical protein